jgi:endonuclease/exonuclease/phosphatase (EEP) superfamily protein YafD
MEGSGLYGIAILSKYPFVNCDTLYIAGIPNIVVCLKSRAPETKIYIVDSYITPPLFTSAYETMQKQLAGISQYVSNLKYPVITLGDYNMEGTSSVIQDFREKAHLNDSRRGFRPVRNDGHISLFEVPMDHIFYSNHLNCIDFQTISGTAYERMGILGTYQINPDSLFNVATIHK